MARPSSTGRIWIWHFWAHGMWSKTTLCFFWFHVTCLGWIFPDNCQLQKTQDPPLERKHLQTWSQDIQFRLFHKHDAGVIINYQPKHNTLFSGNHKIPKIISNIWMFPKMVGDFPPNHPLKHRVFHDFHHFWGFPPIFGNPQLSIKLDISPPKSCSHFSIHVMKNRRHRRLGSKARNAPRSRALHPEPTGRSERFPPGPSGGSGSMVTGKMCQAIFFP